MEPVKHDLLFYVDSLSCEWNWFYNASTDSLNKVTNLGIWNAEIIGNKIKQDQTRSNSIKTGINMIKLDKNVLPILNILIILP